MLALGIAGSHRRGSLDNSSDEGDDGGRPPVRKRKRREGRGGQQGTFAGSKRECGLGGDPAARLGKERCGRSRQTGSTYWGESALRRKLFAMGEGMRFGSDCCLQPLSSSVGGKPLAI